MTNFEDQLLADLMTEHGAQLRQLPRPGSGPAAAPSRGRSRLRGARPAWLAAGAAGLAAAATGTAMTLGGTAPAYAVSRGADGTVLVSVSRPAGVTGANAALHRLHVPVHVVPVHSGCPSISSLPHPHFVHHPSVMVPAGKGQGGHRSISVKVWGKYRIPRGVTMLLAFGTRDGAHLGVGGFITGPVPDCVGLPAPPGGPGGQDGSLSPG